MEIKAHSLFDIITASMPELNEYHKEQIARKKIFMTFMKKHPLSQQECLAQCKRLRVQRIARESKSII